MMRKSIVFILLLFLFALTHAQKKYTLSGYVKDKASGESLIGANIYEHLNSSGAVSNSYGFFSLTLPEGDYKIRFSYVGFATTFLDVKLHSDVVLNANLDYSDVLQEVTVVGTGVEDKLETTQMSKETLSMKMLKNLPAFMGEADVVKAMQLLPGVQSGTEGSAGLYVRGGGPDQNLILLDGVSVYNANHLFGFFSVFNPDAIKNASLYKGGFPARFGGRLSAVLDIRMKEGNEKEFHGGGSIGLISSKFFLEGPIVKDKTSFHVSLRRTYVDALVRPFLSKEEFAGYYFYDLNAKVNHKFSDKSRLYLSAYTGKDKAYSSSEWDDGLYEDKSESNLNWGNLTTALRWNYQFNPKLFSNTTLTYSTYGFNVEYKGEYHYDGELESKENYAFRSGIEDIGGKFEFDWYPNSRNSVRFGTQLINHTFKPGVQTLQYEDGEEKFNSNEGDDNKYANEFNLYVEDDVKLTSKLKANLGLHYSGFDVDHKMYTSFEPRVSMRYLLSNQLTVKAAYSKMQQYLHLLSNSSIGLPTDLWVPVTKNVKPQLSEQYATGIVWNPKNEYTVSVEGFYKSMDNLIEYKEGASFFGVASGWENKVEMGVGRAYGVEFLLRRDIGKTTGWMGYTWSKTERKFDNISFGKWFPAKFDRKHDVSFVLTHKVSDKFDFGATWVYGTGTRFTLPLQEITTLQGSGDYVYTSSTASVYEGRNNYQMPNYHRLDVGMNFHKKKKHGTRTWNISVYNAYNRKNAFYLYLEERYEKPSVLKQVSLFPILPSVSYSYKF